MVTAGDPAYGSPLDISPDEARSAFVGRLALALDVARAARGKVQAPGSLVFMGGTTHRRPRRGECVISTISVATPMPIANLARELAPVRVNLVAGGFVDTRLSASLLGNQLEARRGSCARHFRSPASLEPSDVAALAVHLIINTAITGGTYDVDGGQQLLG
jgi:NAD(P)-dependent dehydrogenase (short-subunit alcohol dehydrogenase family)